MLPKAIHTASKIKRIQITSQKKKQDNIRKHSAPDTIKTVKEREKQILTTEE